MTNIVSPWYRGNNRPTLALRGFFRLSRLSEQALGYGIFALLLCPGWEIAEQAIPGHLWSGTAVLVSHLVNRGSEPRSNGYPYFLSNGEIRANTFSK